MELDVPTITQAPTNAYQWAATVGLGTPKNRAVAAVVATAAVSYATKWPAAAFKDNGTLKRFDIAPGQDDEHKTQLHFVVAPIVAGVIAYLFF
jgi:hypothetical protein